jgi:hypothetical protein
MAFEPHFKGGASVMKNAVAMIFLVIAFAAGGVIFAGIYFGVIFGALDWLDGIAFTDRAGADLGNRIAPVALVAGVVVGVVLSFDAGWDRLTGADGGPDRVARVAGIVVAAPLVLLALYASAGNALTVVVMYKAIGFMAFAGFLGIGGWIHTALGNRN